MADVTETPEDVDRALAKARDALEGFEGAVDSKRLMQRLRFSSPAHPVLLFRFLFGGLFVLCVSAAVVIMGITTANDDIARTIAKFEAVLAIPLPEEIPVMPALLTLLALTMALAWVTATLAALSLGREAQMLPWERKQHQNLVNEVTRLTTQRAVMERIRGTPAGARPRIATPVPLGPRIRSTPRSSQGGGSGGFTRSATPAGSAAYATGRPSLPLPAAPAPVAAAPQPIPTAFDSAASAARKAGPGFRPKPKGGTLASRLGKSGGAPLELVPDPPSDADSPQSNGAPGWPDAAEDTDEDEDTGGVRLGASSGGGRSPSSRPPPSPAARSAPDAPRMSDAAFRDLLDDARPAATSPAGRTPTPTGGILGRARAGVVGLRSTPFGSAGRVRPPGAASTAQPGASAHGMAIPPVPADPAPRRPPKPRPRLVSRPPPTAKKEAVPSIPPPLAPATGIPIEEVFEDELPTATANEPALRRAPNWGPIHEEWLRDAVAKAEALVRSFPQQAYLSYSTETHLPFTLVVARATPAVAVRSMVSFVAFLADIATPPRARIELIGVAHLDRTFHKNVEAALEPHFAGNVEVEPNPGRIDIRFNEPDPQWGAHPVLPIR